MLPYVPRTFIKEKCVVIDIIVHLNHLNQQRYREQYQLGSGSSNFSSKKCIFIDRKNVEQKR